VPVEIFAAFPGNVIPASRLSSQAQSLLALLLSVATLADPTLNIFLVREATF